MMEKQDKKMRTQDFLKISIDFPDMTCYNSLSRVEIAKIFFEGYR